MTKPKTLATCVKLTRAGRYLQRLKILAKDAGLTRSRLIERWIDRAWTRRK